MIDLIIGLLEKPWSDVRGISAGTSCIGVLQAVYVLCCASLPHRNLCAWYRGKAVPGHDWGTLRVGGPL